MFGRKRNKKIKGYLTPLLHLRTTIALTLFSLHSCPLPLLPLLLFYTYKPLTSPTNFPENAPHTQFLLNLILFYPILSLSYPVLSCLILSYPILSYPCLTPVLPLTYPNLSCLILPCLTNPSNTELLRSFFFRT